MSLSCGRGLSRHVYETSANLVSTIGMHTDVVLTCNPAGCILCRRTLVQCSSHRTLPAQGEGGVAPATICKPRNRTLRFQTVMLAQQSLLPLQIAVSLAEMIILDPLLKNPCYIDLFVAQALMMALQHKKLTEEQSNYGIDRIEPEVNFALSCGTRSSPMVSKLHLSIPPMTKYGLKQHVAKIVTI